MEALQPNYPEKQKKNLQIVPYINKKIDVGNLIIWVTPKQKIMSPT